ncbi:DUF4199 domain-containing protein [Chitinophaga agrisoli]|uniref:DUF4199 domain-containing protein n=1 Tax=Chitinophaga agrisoli TaxID=2607653 RepID=A0A5B2VWL7_9BACT|nr:DUF4199 domain-containing protein [Chitinophaga agrisoli]KAA2242998.1 DUF4199 domain-containing protein [Chitinophaga agrisoli]
MKKIVLVCGLIAGLIVSSLMVITIAACYNNPNFQSNMVLGYASMILSFSAIFVGIKMFRDKYNGGVITFGRAFTIGLFITLIASTIYVLAWLVDYYLFIPDFMDKYAAHVLKEATQDGATRQELAQKTAEMASYKEMYKNPIFVILFTYVEIIPVGLVVTIISALILRRKAKGPAIATA